MIAPYTLADYERIQAEKPEKDYSRLRATVEAIARLTAEREQLNDAAADFLDKWAETHQELSQRLVDVTAERDTAREEVARLKDDHETVIEGWEVHAQLLEVERDDARADLAKAREEQREACARHVLNVPGWSPADAEIAVIRSARLDATPLADRIRELEGLRPQFPPMPPNGGGLPRYGLRWPPVRSEAPLAVPMVDGYWTPAHLAEASVKTLTEERDNANGLAKEWKKRHEGLEVLEPGRIRAAEEVRLFRRATGFDCAEAFDLYLGRMSLQEHEKVQQSRVAALTEERDAAIRREHAAHQTYAEVTQNHHEAELETARARVVELEAQWANGAATFRALMEQFLAKTREADRLREALTEIANVREEYAEHNARRARAALANTSEPACSCGQATSVEGWHTPNCPDNTSEPPPREKAMCSGCGNVFGCVCEPAPCASCVRLREATAFGDEWHAKAQAAAARARGLQEALRMARGWVAAVRDRQPAEIPLWMNASRAIEQIDSALAAASEEPR